MKLLLLAAIRTKKHLFLAIVTLVTLFGLTLANQMERFALGVMANSGVDFFTLFGEKKNEGISLQTVEKKWDQVDQNEDGIITRYDASLYVSKNTQNPLSRVLHHFSSALDIEKNLVGLIVLLLVIAVVKAIFLFFSRYATQVLSIRVTKDLRQQFFEHIQSLPLSFYYKHNVGSLTARAVGDAGQIASSLNSMLTNYLQTPFTIVSTLGMCFYLSWQLSMIIFIGLPMIVFPIVYLTKRVKRVSRQMQRNQENFTSVLLDFLSGIHTVKIFSMEGYALKKYVQQNDRMAHLEAKNAKYSLLTRPVLHLITTFCLAVVVIIGLYFLHMSIAQLLVFCGLLHLFYEPVKKFAEENANIQRGVVAAERMFEVLHLKPQLLKQQGEIDLLDFYDHIVFDRVSFKYKNDWVLKNVSFKVKKGETVAIVGPTGAGKSTIVQLLPRLYDPQEGEIRIDGTPISQFTVASLRDMISFVPQKPFLFYDTVLENISVGREFSQEQIVQTSKKAHAHEFIIALGEQYDTILAETGKNLSGGQQQRIAIARALMKNAPILVMDEATSALDAISENKIKSTLKELKKETTQIIIAHRLSTIEYADRIIYIDQGQILAQGTKEEVLKSSKQFAQMWAHFHQYDKNKENRVLDGRSL